uniref:ATP-binding cassette, sub-family E (OABP), member 1 n=1 Tax=Astyanax mexicanus TaxID=7994 RepID=A0A8B9HJ08_ASTMX
MSEKPTRIAIVNHDKCKPKKCRQECKKSCPVVRMGKLCIEVTPQSKIVWISESLCIGCGICIKVCKAVFYPAKRVYTPSSYLDVKQRLKAAITIRSLITPDRYIIVVEHDLSVLDYLSDFICCLYGVPSAYGVVTMPFSVREGINIFLDGYVPTENLRFREASLVFKVAETASEEEVKKMCRYQYPNMKKMMGDFELQIVEGEFTDSEIMVMLGENGTGKTTFIRMLAGRLKPDDGGEVPILNVSYKPQKISPKFKGSVRALLHEKIRDAYTHPQFVTDVMKPMQIDCVIDQDVQNLSGGELQRVALALCLGKPADVYLIDEPSAYLDSEQRLMAARVIKRFILHAKKTAFVVEHDFIMATYLADRVIVFDGVPSKKTAANTPQTLLAGMNKFLSLLEITFRRDPNNFRPRINKLNSIKVRSMITLYNMGAILKMCLFFFFFFYCIRRTINKRPFSYIRRTRL